MWKRLSGWIARKLPSTPSAPSNETEYLERLKDALPSSAYDEIVATATPIVALRFSPADDKLPLTASKVGGPGYWPSDRSFPTNAQGQPLALLAQLNLAELPPLPTFPSKGLLAFYLDPYAALWDLKSAQVVYFPDLAAPALNTSHVPGKHWHMPYTRPLAVRGVADVQYLTPYPEADFLQRFGVDGAKWEERHGLDEVDFPEPHHSLSQLGGYAYFTQSDPRRGQTSDNVLLFQLNSEGEPRRYDILWGDLGVGNFFIKPDDLAARRFDRAWFTWDCH